MHSAPALSLTLHPDRRWQQGMRCLAAVVVTTGLGWLGWHTAQAGQAPPPWMLLTAALSTIPAAWLLKTRHQPHPPMPLAWEATSAGWSLPTGTGHLDCITDTGHWMLLRHHGPGLRTTWLPVSRADHATHWHALRCAVFNPGTLPWTAPADE